jgi:outer membrane protein assembly factor BamB
MRRVASVGVVVLFLLAAVLSSSAQDLNPGDKVPDCSKIPLIPVGTSYSAEGGDKPISQRAPSLEDVLLSDGVVILHFCSPRPPRGGALKTYFLEELSALDKAARVVPYPCSPVAVVPLGVKGREDTLALIGEWEEEQERAWIGPPIYYEPTFPRPGLYRTFRPGTAAYSDQEITTSWTYLIGPEREIIAVRAPGEDGQLYDWLQAHLPDSIVPAPREPTSDLSVARAEPWLWPAFRRTVRRQASAEVLPDTLPYSYVAWQTRVGRSFASPVVVEGRVYAVTDTNGLRALSLDNGDELVSYSLGKSWWTSPAVAGDYVYTVSASGTVVALDRMSLVPEWKRSLHGLVTSSPVVVEGALFVGSRNGAIYALDAATGDTLWRFQTGGEISSSPALANGLVVIGSGDRNLYAIDAKTGKQKWAAATQGAVDSSPTVAGDDVFVGSFDGGLYSVRLADGSINWRCQLGGWVHSSPAVDEDTVFVGTVDIRRDEVPTFNWVDRGRGEVRGSFEMPEAVYSSPTVWGDEVLVGCRDGHLYAFDREMEQTQPVWSHKTGSYLHASPVVVGDTALIASFDGSIYALRQSKPIQVWQDEDVVPRWFMAALAKQLHEGIADLIARAGAGEVGAELSLAEFQTLFQQIRGEVLSGQAAPKVLPRDVPDGHPGAPYIEYVLTAGLLAGYPDATFHPSQPCTRYEFASALAGILDVVRQPAEVWRVLKQREVTGVQVEVRVEAVEGRPPIELTDVPEEHWANVALRKQAQLGVLQVYEPGRFRGSLPASLRDAREQWDLIAKSVKVVLTK